MISHAQAETVAAKFETWLIIYTLTTTISHLQQLHKSAASTKKIYKNTLDNFLDASKITSFKRFCHPKYQINNIYFPPIFTGIRKLRKEFCYSPSLQKQDQSQGPQQQPALERHYP